MLFLKGYDQNGLALIPEVGKTETDWEPLTKICLSRESADAKDSIPSVVIQLSEERFANMPSTVDYKQQNFCSDIA